MILRLATFLALALAYGGPAAARCENVAPEAKPQNIGRDVVGQNLDEIRERGFVTFAVYEDFPPWSWEEGGRLLGIDIALGELIASEIGVEPRFNAVAAGENVDADLRNHVIRGPVVGGGVANVMLHVPYNAELACRNEMAVLTGQYAEERIAIAYSLAEYPEKGPVPAYFRFDLVGVENDSLADFYLSGLAGGALIANIRRFPSHEAAMDALARGEVKAVMGARGQLEHRLGPGLALHVPPLPGLALGQWTLGVAVRENARDLGYAVEDAVGAAIEDGRMAAIFADYRLTWSPPD